MARSTLSDLIEIVRGYTNAGTADYTIVGSGGTVSYWSDDMIQRVLDRYRRDVRREKLVKIRHYAGGGSAEYYDHQSRFRNYEQTDGGSAIFIVEDGLGDDQGTANWTADYLLGMVTFAANTEGTSYYLTGRIFDLYAAAADIWRQKASHIAAGASSFDWSTDNMSMKRSQIVKQAREEADYYAGLASPVIVTLERSDIDYDALD
jgi:hypothetical protein